MNKILVEIIYLDVLHNNKFSCFLYGLFNYFLIQFVILSDNITGWLLQIEQPCSCQFIGQLIQQESRMTTTTR